jgi:N-acetyl-alpha-D-glucosaminyl L-malate synthase BshA
MKIGITCYPTYGGSGALATELGLELARRGHEVHFITYASPFRLRGGYAERVFFHEVETRIGRYPLFEHYPYSLALASKQHEVARREKLDLIHVHYAIPHATTAWLAREMLEAEGQRLPIITTLHGTDITLVGQEASFYAITKFSIERSDRVTAVSAYLRDETYRAFGCVSCDLAVIPNFVNLGEYHPDASRRWDGLAPPDHRRIMHVSNFREVKRVKDVIRIFARIRRAFPATLVMVGDGPERPDAEHEAAELGVTDDVRFLGRLDSVATLLQGCELFLLPSTSESFGLAALEAMACGAVVVASRAGGLPEVLADGRDGILEPVGSVEAMGRRAVDLLRDADRLAAMRAAALASAQAFAADRIVPQYEALYEEVVAGNAGRAARVAAGTDGSSTS